LKQAVREKITSLIENDTWNLILTGKKVIESKWMLKVKKDEEKNWLSKRYKLAGETSEYWRRHPSTTIQRNGQ